MVKWDPTISAGELIQAAALVVAVLVAYIRLRERLMAIETKLEPLWEEFAERRSGYPRRIIDRHRESFGDTGE